MIGVSAIEGLSGVCGVPLMGNEKSRIDTVAIHVNVGCLGCSFISSNTTATAAAIAIAIITVTAVLRRNRII